MYVSVATFGSAGLGAIRDGTCTVVSLASDSPDLVVGGGLAVTAESWPAIEYDGGRVFALFFESLVLAVDVVSGDREAMTSSTLGSGPSTGGVGLALGREHAYTTGRSALAVAIERSTGDRTALEGHEDTPLASLEPRPNNVWVHPNGTWLVIAADAALYLHDPRDQNGHVLSY
jgi:hypothetical protein